MSQTVNVFVPPESPMWEYGGQDQPQPGDKGQAAKQGWSVGGGQATCKGESGCAVEMKGVQCKPVCLVVSISSVELTTHIKYPQSRFSTKLPSLPHRCRGVLMALYKLWIQAQVLGAHKLRRREEAMMCVSRWIRARLYSPEQRFRRRYPFHSEFKPQYLHGE